MAKGTSFAEKAQRGAKKEKKPVTAIADMTGVSWLT